MERESFENPAVAALLNQHFVAIKVDREERPDLDDLYMGAVQAMTGRGGWPMSVWLTPALEPFYGGTYFPLEARHGLPGFPQLLGRIAAAWREQRAELARDASRLTGALRRQAVLEPGTRLPDGTVFDTALAQLRGSFDPMWGGFGAAPKFPPCLALELVLRRGSDQDQTMAQRTLKAMAEGGLYDQLGGGFARYSVDAQWRVPHFEKMLYDNALLARTYLMAFRATKEEGLARVAQETLDYLLRDMRDAAGGFHSSEDADSEGEEGRFYTFRPSEVRVILGQEDGDLFCTAFGVQEAGPAEHGKSVLYRACSLASLAERYKLPLEAVVLKLETLRKRMWEAREGRVRPRKDDKVLACWNGLALSALAFGYQVLRDPRYLEAARECGRFLLEELCREGVLFRTWRRGQAHTPGFLEDYAAVALGLVDLYETTFEPRWLRGAEALVDRLRAHFEDRGEGGFYGTSEGQRDLLLRQKPFFDQALPSANAMAVQVLWRLAQHLDRQDLAHSAEAALQCAAPLMEQAPRACLGLLEGLEMVLEGPLEISLAGPRQDPRMQALLERIWSRPLACRVLSLGREALNSPRHQGKVPVAGQPTVYLCRNQTCLEPVTTPEALERLLPVRHF